ncbi:MAG: hypothetical protein JXA90_01925, partial [Planctomycetes bacterium]|nr:hypothetical protein [Planctomycetota bacterium]
VETLRGRVSLKVPPRTSSDSWLRLKGQGVRTNEGTGDLLVRVVIAVPRDVPPELEAALRRLESPPR